MKPLLLLLSVALAPSVVSLTTSFHGQTSSLCSAPQNGGSLTMRKQKASNRRTRRSQLGEDIPVIATTTTTVTKSPMEGAKWGARTKHTIGANNRISTRTGGRNRARKRSTLYNSLSSYHSHFLELLTAEYKAEEDEVLGRLKASLDDPLALEVAGHALFDMYAERRGNLFSDEVYRLTKANDACTVFESETNNSTLPTNHKFSANDVIMLTYQPNGSGDVFGASTLPTSSDAIAAEARVLSTGPTYVDISMPNGAFEAAFGPAPNDGSGNGNKKLRLRVDRFLSNVPYERMVTALSQLTAVPDNRKRPEAEGVQQEEQQFANICIDDILREAILSTFTLQDPSSLYYGDTDACDLREMARMLARPPLPNSSNLANQVLSYVQSNPNGIFPPFNGPQLTAIVAALTRRLTMIQGPPGTGKTTVAAAVAFGFVHQCRKIASKNTKVLACAFSNVGADNLAESMLKLGLKVVRVGKPSAVSKSLWGYTLDAAIAADPNAQKALEQAATATSQLNRVKRQHGKNNNDALLSEQSKRDAATRAVKASIAAANVAATKALREADVIITTSTGAADPRLMAACGIVTKDEEKKDGRLNDAPKKPKLKNGVDIPNGSRTLAPDGFAPLSLPFVLVDEACQSVEPATLVPLMASNSCRSLVLFGDPCQLPPTVKSSPSSPLSVSLMERLAATLPQPVIMTAQNDRTEKDTTFLNAKATKQALSLLRSRDRDQPQKASYRKQFAGSLLLSVQYRMHPSISAFSSAVFYDSLLSTPFFLGQYRPFPNLKSLAVSESDSSVRFVNIPGRINERRGTANKIAATVFGAGRISDAAMSYSNQLEAERVMAFVKEMLIHDSSRTIGVVTPYNGQVEVIKKMMEKDEEYQKLAADLDEPIEVKSVDGYQGRERDVIIFSAVRSNRNGNIGFLTDWRRMNVALTRAKNALIVIGDLETLEEGDKHWAAFGKWCRGVKCIIEE